MYGLTPKEFFDIRLKCLEMFVTIGSKTGIEQDVVFNKAAKAFDFAIEPLKIEQEKIPQQEVTGPNPKKS